MAWDRIRGHDRIVEQFRAAFTRGRLGHAYLFAGPPGVGKRLFADELTKALVCESPPRPLTACDRCVSCTLLTAGTHPDFYVARKPDDKLEFPIEVMRNFLADFGMKPARGPRKVAVMEDADTFNEESANCFLKTLEEPPPGSVLILLASAAETQLATILSRCQVVRFGSLAPADVRTALTVQGVSDPAKLDRLVRLAQGSVGRAVALTDDSLWQFRAALLDALTAGKPNAAGVAEVWEAYVLAAGKESAAQRERASLVVRLLVDMVAAALRLSLAAEVPGSDAAEKAKLQRLADRLGPDELTDLLEKCVDADYHLDRRVNVPLVIEALADKLARPSMM